MRKNIFIVFMLCLCFSFDRVEELHPIHISIAEVDCFTEKKEIQIALKIFTDDLEKAIVFNEERLRLNLDSNKEIKESDKHIKKYIQKHFQVYNNGSDLLELNYIGKEYEEASTWLYFSYQTNSDVDELEIYNKVIFNIYDDQKNIINVRKNRKIIKTVFTNPKKKSVFVELK